MLDGVVTDIKEAKSFGYRVHHNDIYSCRWALKYDMIFLNHCLMKKPLVAIIGSLPWLPLPSLISFELKNTSEFGFYVNKNPYNMAYTLLDR